LFGKLGENEVEGGGWEVGP